MSRPPLARLCLVVVLLGAALLSGCGKRETAVEVANRSQTLLVGLPGEPSELDPHIINAPPDYMVVPALFEGLLSVHPDTLEPVPGVAERWSLSDDGLRYTFHLRADAKWSNGDPVTSADFLFSFQRALSPALGSQYTFLFDAVVGAADYAKGTLTDFKQVGFAAPDPRTVVITLVRPTPYFLAILAPNPVWYPVHRATIEKFGPLDRRGSAWTKPEHFVGNGPFVLREWKVGQTIGLERAATYWNAAHVALRGLRFFVIEDRDTEERAFRAGQLHVTFGVPPPKRPIYRKNEPQFLRERTALTVFFINLNTGVAPLGDVRVRQALSLSLDRHGLVERGLFGGGQPAFGLVPTGLVGYPQEPHLTQDPERARRLMAEAGFPEGRGFPELELILPTGGEMGVAQAIQEQWRSTLGITVQLRQVESRVQWTNLQQKAYALGWGGWNGDYADASTFLDLFASGNGWNFTRWASPDYDARLAAAAAERNPERRQRVLAGAEQALMDAMPVVPLYFLQRGHLATPNVRGWPENLEDRRLYNQISLTP